MKNLKILMGENLVWNSQVRVGSHQYVRLFLRENEVFWLALPWNLFHLLIKSASREERVKHWSFSGPLLVEKGFYCLSPLTFLPYRNNFLVRNKIFAKWALDFCIPAVGKTLKKYGFDKVDILWLSDPRLYYLTEKVSYKKLFYRCVDDFSRFSDIPKNVIELETALVKKADAVFATSRVLQTRLQAIRPDVIYLPNGVDYDFFSESNDRSLLPEEFKNKTGRIVLYVGTVGEWFDRELILAAARRWPEVNFFIVGPVKIDISCFKNLANVKFFGSLPYASVPALMKASDLGVIPFQINELTEAVSPIKLFEYLASGLPVLAPRTDEIVGANSPARLFSDQTEFLSGLQELLAGPAPAKSLQEFARQNSWQKRYELIGERI